MSEVLSILGGLSTAFQRKVLNLLSIEPLFAQHISAFEVITNDILSGGYMAEINETEFMTSRLSEVYLPSFRSQAKEYLSVHFAIDFHLPTCIISLGY